MAMVSTIIYECEYNNMRKAYSIVTFLTSSFKITPSCCWPPSVLSFSAILKRLFLFRNKKKCPLGRRVVTSHKRLCVTTSSSQILTFESKSKSYLWICLNELSYLWICCFQLLTRPSQALLLYFFLLSGVLHDIDDYHYYDYKFDYDDHLSRVNIDCIDVLVAMVQLKVGKATIICTFLFFYVGIMFFK